MSGAKNQKSDRRKAKGPSWSKAEEELKKTPRGQNEGEGSRSAAAAYDRDQSDFARHGDVEEKAKEAESAREGAERQELEKAERYGKSHSHGEDPSLYRKGPGARKAD